MIPHARLNGRPGVVLPLVLISLVALLGFVALAIDLGMMAVARSQAQTAADAAAMAGARTLNGDTTNNNNYTSAVTNATTTATENMILSQSIQTSDVTVDVGSYSYDTTQNKFVEMIPRNPNDNWSLVRATINHTSNTDFSRIFGMNLFNTTATATAVHRPRDIAIVLDFSGSMRFDSMMAYPHGGTRTFSMNPDPIFPLFGHYSAVASAAIQGTTARQVPTGEYMDPCNITTTTSAGPVLMNDFYQQAYGAAPVPAFSPAAATYATTPGGDNYLKITNNTGATYATTVKDVTGSTNKNATFETKGYKAFTNATFNGYTQGPNYWGKTFFVWPPDPTKDWRSLFFNNPGTNVGVTDNTKLWTNTGSWQAPSATTYSINYTAILNWIKNTGTNPFPPLLRAGRIQYYGSIPSTIDTSTFPPTNLDQRFWKAYIDNILGVEQINATTYSLVGGTAPYTYTVLPTSGYGDDFTWGTIQVSAKPANGSYMNYLDNPKRPRLHFWFGPLSLIDFIGNYNQLRFWWPGTCHEASMYACKLGIQAALQDIERNHPNDLVALTYFNTPKYSSAATDRGRFNNVRVPLSRNYQRMIDSLWFPPSTLDNPTPDITPYAADINEVPHASWGTCTVMGFMQAFNQFSSNSALRTFTPAPALTGTAGGLGRQGAQKMIILETDGMANTLAAAGLTNSGKYNSYYNIRQPGEYPSNSGSAVDTQVYGVVDQICALDSASPPGYSTTRKPVKIHCIAFGSLFEPANFSAFTTQALTLLQTIQYKGQTQSSPSTALPSYKIIVGNAQTRIDNLQQAFNAIMQDGIQVSLID